MLNRRRYLRFSLRTMLGVAICISILMGRQIIHIRQQADAVAMLDRFGATVVYDYQWSANGSWHANAEAPGFPWLKKLLGENYAANVVEVQLFSADGETPIDFTDKEAARLSVLSDLKWLVLMDTRLTDAGLEHFKGLKKLERLDLERSLVTDFGVDLLSKTLPNIAIYH